MTDKPEPLRGDIAVKVPGIGCAAVLACINIILMGLLVSKFAYGPYSSSAQETWYRYGSIAFLIIGALLPAAVMLVFRRLYPLVVAVATVWMLGALLAFFGYAFMSGGGV